MRLEIIDASNGSKKLKFTADGDRPEWLSREYAMLDEVSEDVWQTSGGPLSVASQIADRPYAPKELVKLEPSESVESVQFTISNGDGFHGAYSAKHPLDGPTSTPVPMQLIEKEAWWVSYGVVTWTPPQSSS